VTLGLNFAQGAAQWGEAWWVAMPVFRLGYMTNIRGNYLPANPGAEGEDVVIVPTDALQSFFDMVEDGSLLDGFFGAFGAVMPSRPSIC
jgi:hypothetical protein